MRIKVFVLLHLFSLSCFSQSQIKYFQGTFDEALDSSKKNNHKDIFLISSSSWCPSLNKFLDAVENDMKTIEFLNSRFFIFGFDLEQASEVEKKRLKKYYKAKADIHLIYFINSDEKIITKITYSLINSLDEQLGVWKEYQNFNRDWKSIKKEKRKRNRNKTLDYEFVYKYILYRQIKISTFDYFQIQNVLMKYLKNIDTDELTNERNWELIQKYGTLFSLNYKLTDMIAANKSEFAESVGGSVVSEYLLDKYYRNIKYITEKKVNKIAKKYPYNTIDEAKQAIELYKTQKAVELYIQPFEDGEKR